MDHQELIALNEQIAATSRAGLPLSTGLAAFAQDMEVSRLRRATESIAKDLRAGLSLPEAIDRQGSRVPPYYAGLLRAGVRTGRLADVLSTLTEYTRAVAAARTALIDALLYPSIVIAFALGMLALLLFWIVPQFEEIFREFGLRLPDATAAMFTLSRNATWLFLGLGIVVVGLLLIWAISQFTSAGRATAARAIYSVPLIGTVIRANRLAAFTDLLAILTAYEVPLGEAFQLAGRATADPIIAENADLVGAKLAAGHSLAEAFGGRGLVPEWVSWMAGVGENQGNLPATLRQIAAVYRRQAETRAGVIRSILPPVLILGTASMMFGFFGLSVMLPMIKLLEGLSQ